MTAGRPAGRDQHPGVHQRASERVCMPGLGGTGRLADDLWLLAHHERSGRTHLQPRAVGPGLAGALLAELVRRGRSGCGGA